MRYSIIIPVYNTGAALEKTVNSVLCSGLEDFEIILVDDGSEDGTAIRCDRLAEGHDNVRCIHQKNTGVSGARNRGLQEAEGEYILFFDSDDTVDAGALTQAAELLLRHEPDMLLFGMSFDYYYKGTLYRRDNMACEQSGCFAREQWLPLMKALYACNYLSSVCNKFIRRELIEAHQIRFSESMHLMEDCLFTLKCLERCEQICLVPEAIYRYRQPENERNAVRRLDRIDSLTDYMGYFSALPKEWDTVVSSIYFMLLRQKIGASGPKKIAVIAADHKRSTFMPQTDYDRWLCRQLDTGHWQELYLRNLKSQVRHKIAVYAKSHGLYNRRS